MCRKIGRQPPPRTGRANDEPPDDNVSSAAWTLRKIKAPHGRLKERVYGNQHKHICTDKGTTFQVYLPARSANRKESSLPAKDVPHGHGERILFVDDEPIVGRSTEELLKRLGYTVTRCGQSEEALARFRETPRDFDLIITDWAMPGMSGTELVSAMRGIRSDIPMLLMSGFVNSLVEKTAKMMGIGEILIKPVNPELLSQTVALILSRAAKGGTIKSTRSGSREHV
jgi:CheY-like chemotaxis protein